MQTQTTVLHGFYWRGVDRKGTRVKGEIQACNVAEVKAELRKQSIKVTRIKKKPAPLFTLNRIRSIDIAIFSRQITTMLTAAIPLVQGLDLIANSNDNAQLRQLIAAISHDVTMGIALSTVLRRYPRYFDALYCDLVEVGEQSGRLAIIYERIATYQEKSLALKSKIKKAMLYPCAILTVALGVTLLLLLFVIPQFKEIYQGFGAQLPAFTLFILSISELVKAHWLTMVLSLLSMLFLGNALYQRQPKLRVLWEHSVLHLPILGRLLHKAAIARFARTLATTFSAGIPITDGLGAAAKATNNHAYQSAVNTLRIEVNEGMSIYHAMKSVHIFPNMVTQMIMIGEESGDLNGMLNKVADIYENDVDTAVEGLSSLLEPIIMVVLGIVVGALIIAMYLPIFKLGSVIS